MKKFNFLKKSANTPPRRFRGASRVLGLVLVLLTTLGVGNVWGADEEVAKFESSSVVTASGYSSYSDDYWTLSKGGNNNSCGFNSGNKTTISNAYGTSATTSHYGYTIVSRNKLANVYKLTFVYTNGADKYTTGKLYLGYSTNGTTWSAVPLKSGTDLSAQGTSVGSSNTTYTFEFSSAIASAYYAIVVSAGSAYTDKKAFRFDYVTATYYEDASSCEKIGVPSVSATTDDQTINLSWTNQTGASSYTVTRTPADGTVGTPSKSGDTWSCAITGLTNGTAYTWTVTPVGDGATYCASGNTSASASATPNVSRTIIYYDKDGQHTTSLADGTNIADALNALYGVGGPTSCNTEDYEYFVGWKDGSINGTASSVTLLSTEVVNATNAAKTYYAVWASGIAGWQQVTAVSELTSDKTFVIVGDANTKYMMNGEIVSSRMTNANVGTISISGSTLTTTNDIPNTAKWSIYKSGDYFYIKNGNNYASASNNNNQAQLLTDNTSNYAKWDITVSNGVFSIHNHGREVSNSNDRPYLLNNGTSGWASYASNLNGAGHPLIFVHNSSGINYITTCCDKLASINGSVNLTNAECGAGELKATWKTNSDGLAGIASQVLHIYKASDDSEITGKKVTGLTASTNFHTQTISGLDNCTAYYVKVENISNGGSYCGDGWAGDASNNATTLGYTYGITKTNVSLKSGATEEGSTCDGNFSAQYEAAAGYELPATLTVSGASAHTWSVSEGVGTLTINKANVTGNVSTTIAGTCITPSITANPASAVYSLNESATPLSVTVEGAGAWCGYQWESKVGEGNWVTIPSATNSSYYPSTASAGSTTLYRVKVTNIASGCSTFAYSEAATISVSSLPICAKPTFSPTEGTKEGAQNITLSCETNDAIIYYTTNGDDPQEIAANLYSGAIAVNQTTTIKAIAAKSGMTTSGVASATYTIKCKAPTFTVDAGTYNVAQSVELASEYGTVYYTVDGSDPATDGVEYSEAIQVTVSTTIRAIAKMANCENSDEASAAYTLKCATPTFSIDAGTHTGVQNVELACATDGAAIHYTTNGNTPTGSSPTYSSAIAVSSAQTIKAIATKEGWSNSDIAEAAYTIQYAVKWYVGGTEEANVVSTTYVNAGSKVAPIADRDGDAIGTCATDFMGWTTSALRNGSVPQTADHYTTLFKYETASASLPTISEATSYYAVFAKEGTGKVTVTDELTRATTGVTDGSTSYTTWSNKKATSDAIYAGQSAGEHNAIQLRSNNSNSGVITTTSGGKAKKVTVEWNSNTTSGRTINIYGKNSAYSAASDLYDNNNQGTLLGTIIKGTSTELTITGDYEYIGIRSSSGALYLDEVDIQWETTGTTLTDYVTECPAVEAPTFSPVAGEYHEAKDVTISCATDGAQIRYTTNGEDPTATTGTVYGTDPIHITETTTIKAIAVKGDDVSDVVSATYTITYPRKVTFNVGAGTLSIAPATSLTEETYGEGITLPSATPSSYCVAEGWTFAGWATTNSTTTAPTLKAGDPYDCTEATLYAVYKQGDENYHLVTELPTDEDIPGDYMIVNTANEKVLEAYIKSSYYLDEDATGDIINNTISPDNMATYFHYNHWTVTYESSKWIFYNEYQKKYLYNYCNDGKHHNVGITESKPSGYTIALSDGFAVFTSADDADAHIWYDATHSDFSGTTETTNNLHLYKQSTATYSSTPVCCDDEVTVSKADNPSTGTFTIDKSGVLSTCAGSQVVTVTCVPNAGYHVDAVTETIETDVTIEETEENVYTVTYAKNVSGTSTISVTFAETLTPSFQISQNAFEIGDVSVGATVQRQFTISAAHLEGTSLSITSSNDKFTVSPASLTIKDDGSVEEATVTVTLKTTEANIGGPYSATITLADGATTPNTATVSLTNATIKHQYNVKWYNGTTLLSEANYLDGATISDIPTATSCDQSISHVGWLPNATIDGKQADAPAGLVANEDIPAVTADVEYHAVFAKVGEASWRNTALADLTSEDIFVIAETTGSYALSNDNGTSSAPAAPSITITDGKITSEVTAAMKWNVSGNATDGYTFYPNGNTTTWLYCISNNNGVRVGTSDNKVFTIYSGYLKNTATSRYVGVYKTNPDWRCYESCTGQSNIAGQSFAYYKYIAPLVKDYMTTCAVTFTATYEAGAGTGDDYEDANLIEKKADYTVLGNDVTGFTKTDYRFNGWKCGDDDYAAGETYENVTADLTFVAQWTEKEEAGLEYETSAYEVIQNGSFDKPTLTNPYNLAVTYSSSNESVATVDTEGNVTLVTDAIGSTVITAASEATDTYKAGEASYTLSVASKWALTYTSNVALVGNSDTKASSATVNGYDAMKCGTSGVAGAMEITVPKNTEKLHIHAVGWKDANVTISITGATADPSSLDLTSDDAITGSSSSFTLSKPSTFYKEITLSNITEATTLTLTATSGNRFVVYGVNEEGGIWELPSDDADESDIPSEVNVVVSEDQSLTITNAKTLNNLTVEAGGTVSGTANLTVNNLTIESTSGSSAAGGTSGEVIGTNMTINGDMFLTIQLRSDAMDKDASSQWYCISAPFDVDINSGFYWGSGSQMGHNVDFQIFEWDGDRRATGISGWRRTSGTMKAGIAYFIGFDNARSNQNTIKLKANTKVITNTTSIDLPTHSSSVDTKYSNWNGMGNPNFHHVAFSEDIQAFDYNVQSYNTYETGSYNFVVGTPFFVKDLTSIGIEAADNAQYRAPKRETEERYSYGVRITSEGAQGFDNQMYVRASEDASSEYEIGHDLPTMNGTSSNYGALLWTENYGGKRLAIEEAPLVNNKASYELGIFAPTAGTYSISVAAPKENADLYLTYEGSIIWNLSEGAYTLDLNKGITNGYGLILRANAPSAATGIDEAESGKQKAESVQKIILDEKVFILRGGKMYDVTGKAVK